MENWIFWEHKIPTNKRREPKSKIRPRSLELRSLREIRTPERCSMKFKQSSPITSQMKGKLKISNNPSLTSRNWDTGSSARFTKVMVHFQSGNRSVMLKIQEFQFWTRRGKIWWIKLILWMNSWITEPSKSKKPPSKSTRRRLISLN